MNVERAKVFAEIVEHRRSCRVYDGSPVPEEVMREALRLALLAPTSSNLQSWEFHWVRHPEMKADLVKACLSQPAAATAPELVVAVARTKSWKKVRAQMLDYFFTREAKGEKIPTPLRMYYDKLVPIMYGQGWFGVLGPIKKLVFRVGGLFRPMPQEPAGNADMRVWATKTTALACENFMLAIAAYGYDTCPMEGMDSRRVKRLLGLPGDAVVAMVISVGKRSPKGIYGERIRFASEQFVIEHN